MTIIRCNDCDTLYEENEINIVECTKCKTDEYLMELVTPNEDCQLCDHHNDYTCFDCEEIQIKEKYPNAVYDNNWGWEIKNNRKEGKQCI